ncbi:hypothetical protein BGZ61DRAFT_487635 [Ilyonectria robusta]|uniref:uncharacterized protein n=1 Tax=Ilyonectria robusta TaxID=1079257 RepID=UPI001E8CB014|nr:uncharacterized protein BGZ61DRAFT_487635 [Ilyonectria robusta]KAH8651682.1 hypothetical protein BGZ61DRAFT_487635 [Ilyonectria robusta]
MNAATQSQALVKAEPRQQTPPRVIPARPQGQQPETTNTTNASANGASSNRDMQAFMAVVQRIFLHYQQQMMRQQSSLSQVYASANGASCNRDLQVFMAVAQRIFLQYQQHGMRQQSSRSQVSQGQQPQTTNRSTNNTNNASANDASSDLALRVLSAMQQALRELLMSWQSSESQVSQTAGWQSSERVVNGQAPVPAPTSTRDPALSTATEVPNASPPTTAARAPALAPAPSRPPAPASGPAPRAPVLAAPAPAPVRAPAPAPALARAPARAPGRLRPHPKNTRNGISARLDSRADQRRSRRQARARRQALRRVWEHDLPTREATQYGEELITLNGMLTAVFTNGRGVEHYFRPHGENEGMSLEDGSLANYMLQELFPHDPPGSKRPIIRRSRAS